MEKLIAYFADTGFTVDEATHIAESFSYQQLAKGDYFVQEGKISERLSFIEKGYFQYFILLDGEEKTTYSVGENGFAASLVSFLKQVPAQENIRAVVATHIWTIGRAQLKALRTTMPSFQFGRYPPAPESDSK